MRNGRTRYRRRRLRWQFVVFCVVCALLAGGAVYLLTRCSANKVPSSAPAADTEATQTDAVPAGYTALTGQDMHNGDLILVNNKTAYTFPAADLVCALEENQSSSYFVRDNTILLERRYFTAMDTMLRDFYDATGNGSVNLTSGQRSKELQQELFDNSAAANGLAHANSYVAKPGYSEHHTGLACDLNIYHSGDGTCEEFAGTGDYAWINEHCADYGIILRYAAEKELLTGIAAESWHYRYVGVPHARYIMDNQLCLEEYIDLLRGYTVDAPLSYGGCSIYFCPADALYVPSSGSYTVSGNNVDGFVVTVQN